MARKGTEIVTTIESLTRLKNSVNGNPRYRLHFSNGDSATTQSDASISYGLQNSEYRNVPVRVMLTAAGRVWNVEPTGAPRKVSVQPEAEAALQDVLALLKTNEVEHYGVDKYQAMRFMLAGNGPTVFITFLVDDDGDMRSAFLSYSSAPATAHVEIPQSAAEDLFEALNSYGH